MVKQNLISEGIVTDLKILDVEYWIGLSDHVPIVF